MMKIRWLALLFPIRLALAILLLFLLWHLWVFLRPRPTPLSVAELNAARRAAQTAAEAVRTAAANGPLRIGIAHLVNDPTDAVTDMLKTEFANLPGMTVEEGSPIQKFLGDISRAIRDATSIDEVIHAARRVDLDVIVGGRVLQVESTEDTEGRVLLQIMAYDCRQGAWLARDAFEGVWSPHIADKVAGRILGLGPRGRFLLWLLVVLALPWATIWGTRWALERRSNLASFILIIIYTLAGLLLAVALSGFHMVGAAAWWRFFGAFLLCAAYNYWACETIAKRATR